MCRRTSDADCSLTHRSVSLLATLPSTRDGCSLTWLETRKELISDTAVFDERVFPGNSKDPVVLLAPEPEPVSFDDPVVVELDESEDQVGVRQPVVAPQPPLPGSPQTHRCLSLLPLLLCPHLLLHLHLHLDILGRHCHPICLSISDVIH